MRTRILIIFALSGAAGLIDEIVWSRQLVLVFGNTTQAVSAILVGFFGGMAIGAPIGGRLADRVKSPLRLYGLLEIALAVVVILTPLTFQLINEIYRSIYPGLEGSPQALALVRMGLAVLALAPATIMMGATLPSLTRYLTQDGHLSKAFGKLYAANIMGAIIGTLGGRLHPHRGSGSDRCPGRRGRLLCDRRCRGPAPRPASSLGRVPAIPGDPATERPEVPTRPPTPGRSARRCRHRTRPRRPRPDGRLRLRLHFPRLPGAVDADARIRNRQHHLRLHGDPGAVPHRAGHRGTAVQHPPPADHRSGPAARGLTGPRRARSSSSASSR